MVIKLANTVTRGVRKMGRLRPGIIMAEKNLQVVLLMIVKMGRLLSGMKMGRNI